MCGMDILSVNTCWPAGNVRLVAARSRPRYGWNVLRWLFRRPLYYEVAYTFEHVWEPLQ